MKNIIGYKEALGSLVVLLSVGFSAESSQTGKQQYHLFNPTPKELMREMSTDRPDKTESPYTVDAGHLQLEMSFLDYTYNHDDPDEPQARVDSFSVVPANMKVGLLNNVDLQVVLNPYIHEVTRDDGVKTRRDGFGDVQTRLKINFGGNDAGDTAFAAMPFIEFPTNTDDLGNDKVEGGVILPLAVALPGGWNMGLMAEFDFNQNSADEDYHTEYIHSITFGHAIAGNLNGYVEFFSNTSTEDNVAWVSTVDAGLTYGVNEDIQLDLGVNVGVTRFADDLNPFCGLSMRY